MPLASLKFAEVARLSAPLNDHDANDGSGKRILDDCIGYRVGGREYWVERGFCSDYASRPIFSRVIVRWNKLANAAVIHDKPFACGYVFNRLGDKRAVSLREINRVFRKIAQHSPSSSGRWLSKDRANPVQAWANWAGLLAGSWLPWMRRPRPDLTERGDLGCLKQ
jgi:hypothetical protein